MLNRIRSRMMKVSYATLLAMLLFTLTGSGSFPTKVLASCSGVNCAGADPQAQGCASGATTVASIVDLSTTGLSYPGLLELRYSGSCKAEWARVTNHGCCWWYMGATAWSYENYSYSYSGGGSPYELIYTPMVSHVTESGANNPGKACGKVWGSSVAVPILKNSGLCTGWW
jgi:hypothetical protein